MGLVLVDFKDLCSLKATREIDIGTHISLKNDYIYFQVSKSASSTVKFYLQELEVRGTQRKVVDVNNRNLSPHIWPSQLTEQNFCELLVSPNIRKISFVRNPFSRILSCYLHRIKEATSSSSVKNIMRFTRNRFDASLSFADFVNIICDQTSLEQDSHWRVQSDEIFFELIPNWDFIGKVEKIQEDLPRMIALLTRREESLGALNDLSPSVTKADSKLSVFYTKELQQKIIERYKADFNNFSYSTALDDIR